MIELDTPFPTLPVKTVGEALREACPDVESVLRLGLLSAGAELTLSFPLKVTMPAADALRLLRQLGYVIERDAISVPNKAAPQDA